MRRGLIAALVAVAAMLAAPTGQAISMGQLDRNRHPEVGALVAAYGDNGEKDVLCSGTLIASDVFLTAAHCTAYLESIGIRAHQVWVTFDPVFDEDATLYRGTYHTNPEYGGGENDTHDLAVVILDEPISGIEPARLPERGLLAEMKASGEIRDQVFTAVGYGTVRDVKTGGPNAMYWDPKRRFAEQYFLSLHTAWLTLSENPSTGSGGTCFGDSGGPHFLGGPESNELVSITVTGDAMCRATDTTYRLDTLSARRFLSHFVALP